MRWLSRTPLLASLTETRGSGQEVLGLTGRQTQRGPIPDLGERKPVLMVG